MNWKSPLTTTPLLVKKNQEDEEEVQPDPQNWERSYLRPGQYEWICSVCKQRNFQTRKTCRRRSCQGIHPDRLLTDDQEEEDEKEDEEDDSDKEKGCMKKEAGEDGGVDK